MSEVFSEKLTQWREYVESPWGFSSSSVRSTTESRSTGSARATRSSRGSRCERLLLG